MILRKPSVIDPRDVRRLERVLADLRHLLNEGEPPFDAFRDAPVLDGWSGTLMPQDAIIGRLGGAGRATAYPLVALSPDRLWARSLHGWVRLGRHVDETDLSHS